HKLGNAKTEIKDWDGAVSAYRRALAISPELPHTQEKLQHALQQKSACSTAKTDSSSSLLGVLTELPDEPEIYLSASSSSL
ncbi:MAG: hypothetical protein AAFR77_00080, partial [Cyanobacteria bacterium J06631_2]